MSNVTILKLTEIFKEFDGEWKYQNVLTCEIYDIKS